MIELSTAVIMLEHITKAAPAIAQIARDWHERLIWIAASVVMAFIV